jgi:hypothetical protein
MGLSLSLSHSVVRMGSMLIATLSSPSVADTNGASLPSGLPTQIFMTVDQEVGGSSPPRCTAVEKAGLTTLNEGQQIQYEEVSTGERRRPRTSR